MGMAGKTAVLALASAMTIAFAGCEKSRDEMRPDMDTVVSGEKGMQSRDLREMTDKMAPDLLTIPEIVQNPNKITVVMKPIQNRLESNPTRDLTIYVARLKTLLNSSASRDRIAFVEDRATLQQLQGEELGNQDVFGEGGRPGAAPNPRIVPQFALWGTFYEQRNTKTSYYLCTFRLTNIATGQQVWEGSYEVRTLN